MTKAFWFLLVSLVLTMNFGCAGRSIAPLVKDPATGMELVFVTGGCYKMGDTFGDGGPEEKPVHEVCVDDFYLGKHEVTQSQWIKLMGNNPSTECGAADCPVNRVSWADTQEFITMLNGKSDGSRYRLPTEAEWEYAARSGGKSEKYSGGDIYDVAWYAANAYGATHAVGTKAPNGVGLYDMSGNVWEWTNDWYGSDYYSSSPRKNPAGPASGNYRVVRGGSRNSGPFDVRNSYRNYLAPDYRGGVVGFRLLRVP